MILFRQLMIPDWCSDSGKRTSMAGQVVRVRNMDQFRRIHDEHNSPLGNLHGNVVDLETGEVLSTRSIWPLPAWVNDPLARAIVVARFKASRKKVYDCTADNAPL